MSETNLCDTYNIGEPESKMSTATNWNVLLMYFLEADKRCKEKGFKDLFPILDQITKEFEKSK